ncbi:early nodulin-like protein 17 [Ziziphus jujuba]|uniref:Early nodulin-like protein 17 n=1 Tax=Ziziphus jujuba TaxID=326968 RepID=A0A6P4A1T3_ZIZJJ|nr:early nodulin-like protein 17 [Ziziphus jujuba]
MEGLRRGVGYGSPAVRLGMVVFIFAVVMMMMIPEASATRWTVGGNKGWTSNVNYTIWARDIHFYNGDWLFFVYDRNQMDVLEVNKTNYESCNADHPLHNWTTGAGRDVVPLNVTRHYYFISGKGFCYGGMKLAVRVENLPPPPSSQPINEKSSAPKSTYHGRLVLPAVLAVGAVWDVFVRFL